MRTYKLQTARGHVILRQLLLLSSVATFLAFAPSLSRADTLKVSQIPGVANAGGGTVDGSTNSVTARASSLTNELLGLLTAMQMKNSERGVSEEFFTFDNVRSGNSESPSAATMIGGGNGGGAVSTARHPELEPVLIGWNLRNSGGDYYLYARAGIETVPAQVMFGMPGNNGHQYFKYFNGNLYSNGKAAITGNAVHNPFVQKNSEVGLSIAGVAAAAHAGKKVFSLDRKNDVSALAVPEPRFNSLLLLCGIMTAVLVYRRRPRGAE